MKQKNKQMLRFINLFAEKKGFKYLCKKSNMAVLRFFKLPKPKKFEYTPLYYDPKKEEMEEREKRIATGINSSQTYEEDYSSRIKGSMRSASKRKQQKNQKTDARTSNMRIVLIILVLAFLAWYFILR